ncbi:DUF4430 domain-containing protein [Sediminibacillus massiliensis]|uniref:DUF4430 domain-containing protein n=1 Tax=Sediminibacillus massiliensis TaxID=1926277 RepID=UPI0009883958|nr:DUF4430 domain-containing protein [Sediminibacillus massiliensis]
MKNIFSALFLVLFLVTGLVGCGQEQGQEQEQSEPQTENASETENEESVSVTISEDGEDVIAEEDIPIEEGDILLDVMKENFEVEESDGFITSIEGVSQDEEAGKYWMYYVNGEMAEVGANEKELSPDDEVTFDLQAME